jgi:general secretion pathway protein L
MSVLKIYVPENWRAAEDTCSWLLAGDSRSVLARGESTLPEMPKANETIVIVAASRVLLVEVTLPKGSRRQLRQALPFAVEDKVTTDPETVHVAAGTTRPDGTTPVAVVDKVWMRGLLNALHAAGIFPRRMLVETLAVPLEPGAWTMVWRENGGFARTGEASGFALAGPLELTLALREQPRPERIVVRPHTSLPDLAHWQSDLDVPLVAGPRWDLSEAHDGGINLLQGEFAGNGKGALRARLRPVFALAAGIVVLHFCLTLYDWARLRIEVKRLNAEIEQTFRTAFPDAKVIVDAPLQMQRNLDAMRRASGQVERGDFLPLLAGAARTVKTAGSLQAVSYEQEKLKVDVKLKESQAAERLVQAFDKTGLSASLDSMNSKDGAVEARYTIARGGR